MHIFVIVPPSIPYSLVLTSLLPLSVQLFTCYLPFLLPLHPLSSPVMEANLSPADVLMFNGCGSIFYDACSKQEA